MFGDAGNAGGNQRLCLADEPGDHTARSVPCLDLGHPLSRGRGLPVRCRGYVAVDKSVPQQRVRRLELPRQDVGQASFRRLEHGVGVMRHQTTHDGVGVLHISQIPGTVQGVEPGVGQLGRVADVMQPGGSLQHVGVFAEDGC